MTVICQEFVVQLNEIVRLNLPETYVHLHLGSEGDLGRQIGGRTWPVLVPGGCQRSGKEVYFTNFGGQLYQGVSGHLKGSKPAPGQLYCLQKLIRDRLEVAHGQFWSQEAAEGQARYLTI